MFPKAERPAPDEAQGDQVARTGESLPAPSQTSGPTEGAAPTENKASGDQGARAGESLPAQSHVPAQAEGAAPTEAVPAKTEKADADTDYTSESTEEVPALKGTPLSRGARMWTPSQFPLTMALCKDLRTGEFLPEEVLFCAMLGHQTPWCEPMSPMPRGRCRMVDPQEASP